MTYANVIGFANELSYFNEHLTNYCSANLDSLGEFQSAQEAVRTHWVATMMAWQRLELAQFGPLGDNGAALRREIYSWDIASKPSLIFSEAIKWRRSPTTYKLSGDVAKKGIDALQAALFEPKLGEQCASFVSIPTEWTKLSKSEQHAALCGYLKLAADDLNRLSDSLRVAWHPEQGNYEEKILGDKSDHTVHQATEAIAAALGYLDIAVKDKKIAVPLRLKDTCSGKECSCYVENRYARTSKEAILANLQTFESYFSGVPEVAIKSANPDVKYLGFDDFLANLGRKDLAVEMSKRIGTAKQSVAALGDFNLHELSANLDEPSSCEASQLASSSLCQVYLNVKAVTDLFKTEFAKALDLKPPGRAGGDGD